MEIEVGALKIHADDHADPGEWVAWANENGERYTCGGKPIEIKIRRASRDLARELLKVHQRKVWNARLKIHESVDMDTEEQAAYNDDLIDQCWLDVRNLVVRIGDAGGAAIAGRALGRTVAIDESVSFEGALSREVKDFLGSKVSGLGNFILRRSSALEAADEERRKNLSANLSRGSTSSSSAGRPAVKLSAAPVE